MSDLFLCTIMALNALFIYLYFTRRKADTKSWFDEPIAWSLLACATSYFTSTIILGQLVVIFDGSHLSFAALGLAYYYASYFWGAYALIEAGVFVYGEVMQGRIAEGKLKKGDLNDR